MPIYEYTCDRCGQTIERIERVAAASGSLVHEGCGGALTRAVSAPVTRAGAPKENSAGVTDSMRRFRENQALAAEKSRKS